MLARLQERLLGAPQRFLFENDASDEDLADDHWFWDERLSGGIFVEHGVHFFDAAAMLVGRPVTSVQASAARRTGTGLVDLVSATVHHGPDVLATHTHSFTHAHRCERQLMRLDYGAAEARVDGWIPIDAVIDLWTDDAAWPPARRCGSRSSWPSTASALAGTGITVDVRRDASTGTARGGASTWRGPHRVRSP